MSGVHRLNRTNNMVCRINSKRVEGITPISFVQSKVGTGTSVLSFNSNVTAGSLIVAVFGWAVFANDVTDVTDTLGNTYFAVSAKIGSGGFRLRAYYAMNSPAGANTLTAIGDAPLEFSIAEYQGIATTGALDVEKSATGSSSSPSSGLSAMTAQANELLIGAVRRNTFGTVLSAGSGFTLRANPTYFGYADRVVSAAGQYEVTFTLSNSAAWVCQLASFKGL